MSLRLKFFVVMTLPVVVLIAATVALFDSRGVTSAALTAERQTTALHDAFGKILIDLNHAETTTRGYIITRKASYLKAFEQDRMQLPIDLRAITDLVHGDRANAAGASSLSVLAYQRLSLLQTTQAVAQINGAKNADALDVLMNGGNGVSDQIAQLIDSEEAAAARQTEMTEQRLDDARHVSFLIGTIALPLGVLISLIVVMWFMERVVNRIRSLERVARSLEEGMPMLEPSTSPDELGRLERVLVLSGTRVVELQGELRRMGTSDALTRLMNRRGFLPTAEHRLELAKRNDQRVGLMFLDIDGLKDVNDTLGHSAGDGMITEAAYMMRETFRASDLIARMGGDEFCVLFETDSEREAKAALERLEAATTEANKQAGRPFTLSISAGLAMFDPREPRPLDELLAIADEQMYACKRAKAAARAIDASPDPVRSVGTR